jgi:2-C-methyl-D-erythritol 4-phosphate cytidylyltransferase
MWCVVPAAGQGIRLGAPIPKQYCLIQGKTVLDWTLNRLASHPKITGIIVVLSEQDTYWSDWGTLQNKPILTCVGGETRAHSVLAGLNALPAHAHDWVLIHDAARPCITHGDISELIRIGTQHSVGAILAARIQDTVKQVEAVQIRATLDRSLLWRALTPQLFKPQQLRLALATAINAKKSITDDAHSLEQLGFYPMIVEGRGDNIKITLAQDLAMADCILQLQHQIAITAAC